MPKNLADLRHGRTPTDHCGCQAVAEEMRAAKWWAESGPGERTARDCTNGGLARQAYARCLHAQENPAGGTLPTVLVKVQRQRFPDIGEQGQPLQDAALSTDENVSHPPLEIAEFEGDDFSSTQT